MRTAHYLVLTSYLNSKRGELVELGGQQQHRLLHGKRASEQPELERQQRPRLDAQRLRRGCDADARTWRLVRVGGKYISNYVYIDLGNFTSKLRLGSSVLVVRIETASANFFTPLVDSLKSMNAKPKSRQRKKSTHAFCLLLRCKP